MKAALYKNIIPSSACVSVVSTADIKTEQAKQKPPKEAIKDDDGMYKMGNKIWILNEAIHMK